MDFAGVPGLEPRMAEPESAVLPITPYPIGCLEPLVSARLADHYQRLRRVLSEFFQTPPPAVVGRRADYQRFRALSSMPASCSVALKPRDRELSAAVPGCGRGRAARETRTRAGSPSCLWRQRESGRTLCAV